MVSGFQSGSSVAYSTYKLVLLTRDVGDIHVVGRRAEIFQLLRSEDVDGDKMDLGMPVLASLGSAHFDDFAGTTFDHHEAVLSQGGALHRIGRRCASISAIESVLMLL